MLDGVVLTIAPEGDLMESLVKCTHLRAHRTTIVKETCSPDYDYTIEVTMPPQLVSLALRTSTVVIDIHCETDWLDWMDTIEAAEWCKQFFREKEKEEEPLIERVHFSYHSNRLHDTYELGPDAESPKWSAYIHTLVSFFKPRIDGSRMLHVTIDDFDHVSMAFVQQLGEWADLSVFCARPTLPLPECLAASNTPPSQNWMYSSPNQTACQVM